MKPIEKKLTKVFREYVVAVNPVCLFWGKREDCRGTPTECAHILAGRHDSTRWVPGNAVGLCRICHQHQHQDVPKLLEDWFITEHGEATWYGLVRLHNTTARWTKFQLEDHYRWLKEGLDAARG